MRIHNVTDPVYAPNSYGGPAADPSATDDGGIWHADGEMVRAAYTLRPEDDDWGQAGHDGPRGPGRRRPRPAGRQHRRPPAQRRERAGPAAARSSTGATWTRTSATGSRPASAPSRTRRTPRPRSRPTRPGRARRPRPDRAAGCPPPHPAPPPRPRPRLAPQEPRARSVSRDIATFLSPMGIREDDPLPVDVGRLKPDTFAGDVITKPAVSPLIAAARSPAASSSSAPSWGSRQGLEHRHGGHSVPSSGVLPATSTVSTAATTHGVRG